MKKEQIENMIDKKIEKSLSEKETIFTINQELCRMSENISKTLTKIEVCVDDFDGVEFDLIEPVRVRYVVHYVRHCRKRKLDLVWLLRKRMIEDLSKIPIEKNLNKLSTERLLKMYKTGMKRNRGMGSERIKRILNDREHIKNGESKTIIHPH